MQNSIVDPGLSSAWVEGGFHITFIGGGRCVIFFAWVRNMRLTQVPLMALTTDGLTFYNYEIFLIKRVPTQKNPVHSTVTDEID